MRETYLQRMKDVLQEAVDTRFIAGANLLVLQDGKEVLYTEAGMADIAAGKPIRRDTIFRLYSMSKPVTSAAVMLLLERGQIDLLDPVSKYLDGFREPMFVHTDLGRVPVEREIEIRDLLSMTSGMTYGNDQTVPGCQAEAVFRDAIERIGTPEEYGTIELINRLAACDLEFQPGTRMLYGTSADVLGAVVETASGMRFGEFLQQEIFEPLGMTDTGFGVPEGKRDRLSKVYVNGHLPVEFEKDHLAIIQDMNHQPAFESGGAGLVSTIDDYANFAQMLFDGSLGDKRILSERTARFMTTSRLYLPLQARFEQEWHGLTGFTYGNLMRVCIDPGRAQFMAYDGEYGWDGWLGAYFMNAPKEKVTMLLMYQLTDAGTTRLTRQLRNLLTAATE